MTLNLALGRLMNKIGLTNSNMNINKQLEMLQFNGGWLCAKNQSEPLYNFLFVIILSHF